MTRIIGGVAGGRSIRTPPGAATRPTSDRVREALFSSIESTLGTLHGRTFLDVFAGSGAVGLEAASRGAEWVMLVERSRPAAALITANAQALGLRAIEVMTAPASALPAAAPRRRFDVAYFDPPYDMTSRSLADLLVGLVEREWLAPGALVVVERARRSGDWVWPGDFETVRDRRYGDTILWYGRWVSSSAGDPAIGSTQGMHDPGVT